MLEMDRSKKRDRKMAAHGCAPGRRGARSWRKPAATRMKSAMMRLFCQRGEETGRRDRGMATARAARGSPRREGLMK